MQPASVLDRLESIGICFLTSNRDIDPALLRRVSLHLRVELPDIAERAAPWQAMLLAAASVAPDLDVQGSPGAMR